MARTRTPTRGCLYIPSEVHLLKQVSSGGSRKSSMVPRLVEFNCGAQSIRFQRNDRQDKDSRCGIEGRSHSMAYPCCSSIIIFIPHGRRSQRRLIIGCAVIDTQEIYIGIRKPGFPVDHRRTGAVLKKAMREAHTTSGISATYIR